MFEITKMSDIEITTLTFLIYGEPGKGKTSLAGSAKNPIIIDSDGCVYRSMYTGEVYRITSYDDIGDNINLFLNKFRDFDTIVFDTIDSLLEMILLWISKTQTNLKGNLQKYGALIQEFVRLNAACKTLNKDVIFVAHGQEKQQDDVIIVRPRITGQSYDRVLQKADYIGYVAYRDGKYIADFSPNEKYVTKDATGLGYVVIGKPDMASIMQVCKDRLNAKLQAKATSDRELKETSGTIGMQDIAGLNNVIEHNKHKSFAVKKQIFELTNKRAKEIGAIWLGGKYVETVSNVS